jgi:putative transposase
MTAQVVTEAPVMTIWRRGKPEALLRHSGRGSQYTSEQFQRLMADHGVVCSMSRSGNVWDNAAMESFFSSLKTTVSTSPGLAQTLKFSNVGAWVAFLLGELVGGLENIG